MAALALPHIRMQVWNQTKKYCRQYDNLIACISTHRNSLVIKEEPQLCPDSGSFMCYTIPLTSLSFISSDQLSSGALIICLRLNDDIEAKPVVEYFDCRSSIEEEMATLNTCCLLVDSSIAASSTVDLIVANASGDTESVSLFVGFLQQNTAMEFCEKATPQAAVDNVENPRTSFLITDEANEFFSETVRQIAPLPMCTVQSFDTTHVYNKDYPLRHRLASPRAPVEPQSNDHTWFWSDFSNEKQLRDSAVFTNSHTNNRYPKLQDYRVPKLRTPYKQLTGNTEGSPTKRSPIKSASTRAEAHNAWNSFAKDHVSTDLCSVPFTPPRYQVNTPRKESDSSIDSVSATYKYPRDTGGYLTDPRRDFNSPESEVKRHARNSTNLSNNYNSDKRKIQLQHTRAPRTTACLQDNLQRGGLSKHGCVW